MIGRAAAACPVKIGLVGPRTGALAAFDAGSEFVLAGVREAIRDGVAIVGVTHPVEIVVRDSQSNPSRAAEVAAELITGQGVSLMLVSSATETVGPVSDQCEVNGVPYISTDVPWEAYFFGRGGNPAIGFDYTYHFFWGLSQIVKTFTSLWASVDTNRRVGAAWSNDSDGVALSNPAHGFPAGFKAAGYEVLDAGLFTPLSSDFSAQIAKLKAARCDILTGAFLPADFATFWAQCGQQGFRPKVATIAKALLFPSSIEALGERGVGLSSEIWWSPHHPYKSGLTGQSAGELCAAFSHATGRQWVQPIGFKHALLEVAIDVLRRTRDIDDPKSIVAAIAATRYHSIVGPIAWQGGPVRNVSPTPLVGGQWARGRDFKYDVEIVNNAACPEIATARNFEPIAY